jgi:hypothetical protein
MQVSMAVPAAQELAGAYPLSPKENKSLTLGSLETQLDFDVGDNDDARLSESSLGTQFEVNSDDGRGGNDDIAEGDSKDGLCQGSIHSNDSIERARHQGSNHVVDSNEIEWSDYDEDDLLSEPPYCPRSPSKPLQEPMRRPFKRFLHSTAMVVEGRRQGSNRSTILIGSDKNEDNERDMFIEFPETSRRPVKRRVPSSAAIVGHPASLLRYKRKMGRGPE